MSFPWSNPNSLENCGCSTPKRKTPQSIFKRIASATGSWISGLLGATTGQIIVRNDDTLNYLDPNCEGFVKVDTNGDVTIETPQIMEGVAAGNPLGYGYIPYLELFDKEICNPDGGLPTEEQWMRIKALMPNWIATGEIALINKEDCASDKVRFDFLQPCPLPDSGCPPSGLGYLASAMCDVPDGTGCVNRVRRWYWVTGLSVGDGDLIKNAAEDVDIENEELWRLPVLRRRGGCWFFEAMTPGGLLGDASLTFRTGQNVIYDSTTNAPSDVTTPVAIPGYAEVLAKSKPGSPIYGLFWGRCMATPGNLNATGTINIWVNDVRVIQMIPEYPIDAQDTFGELGIELDGATVDIRQQVTLLSGALLTAQGIVKFVGFQYTPK